MSSILPTQEVSSSEDHNVTIITVTNVFSVQASLQANTFAITGPCEEKRKLLNLLRMQ